MPPEALAILDEMAKLRSSELVFPGLKRDRPLSNMAMLQLLRRMGRDDITVHGFRATFRTWVAERTGYQREVAEAALAHTIGNKVEASYQRGPLLEKRKRLMNDWATYCTNGQPETAKVVSFRDG